MQYVVERGWGGGPWAADESPACFFLCFPAAPKGSPEISWISHDSGPASGGNEIGLIGSRFNKGCKVRFYSE